MELNFAQVFGAAADSKRAANVYGPASILIVFMRDILRIGRPGYRAGAPEASQAAIVARSESVISVMLPGGMAFDHAALRPIRRAWRRMCSGPSRRIAFGAVASEGHTGSAAWHMLHRVPTIRSTWAKLAPDAAAVMAPGGPAADKTAIAAIPAATTPHTHQGEPRPAWRALKKWRMMGPKARTIATISQL